MASSVTQAAHFEHIRDLVKTNTGRNGWPGYPVTNLPMAMRPHLTAMIRSGEVHLVDVRKPSNADPSKTVTYTYVAFTN